MMLTRSLPRARPNLLRAFSTSPAEEAKKAQKRWNDELTAWDQTIEKSMEGDPIAQTDVGWAWHTGRVPQKDSPPNSYEPSDLDRAIKCYEISANNSYSPAASLLADINYYGKELPQDLPLASKWLNKVLETTEESEPADAYIRGKALQKLGLLNHPSSSSLDYLKSSLDLMSKHLNGNWPFLLAHDPPGLWEFLSREQKLLDDTPKLAKNLNGFKSLTPDNLSSAVALRSYTNALRSYETHSKPFSLNLLTESLSTYSTIDEGNYGVTYLESLFRIYGHPIIQSHLQNIQKPKVIVLGSR
ncbi:hypothetical protein TL16_g07535 [Triparma laevis f. inornata]|uniref:Uncharacterized protein n=1 Tax=Triparma laevis f. inornata TaxID=1714386 RepID=A0A9W7AWD9_9STRA|nr:hypothetical protein TL16_g07535 [Triparma laevis f. inornata]